VWFRLNIKPFKGDIMNRVASTLGLAAVLMACAANANPPKQDGLWRGAFSGSLAVSSGNTDSTNLSLGADAIKATKEDKLALYLTTLYGTRDAGGQTTKTANLARAGIRYEWNMSDRRFVFGALDLERDKLQSLDLRSTIGAGLGYKVIKEADLTWDVFAGLTQNRDNYSTFTRSGTEVLLGQESAHKWSATTTFKQRLAVYPSLKDSGEYRAQFDAGLVTSIASGINLQVTLSNRYNSLAPVGSKKSDTLFLTGINIAFGAK
jgi:putative salt-induced outer membrane protein